jgi:peptide/nickel transport system ATP-binding protein
VSRSTGEHRLLEVTDLSVTFATPRGPLRAVDGVSFSVDRGRTLGIVGESGSGKSVTVRSLMNILPSTATIEGDLRFDGRDVRSLTKDERRHFWGVELAMVFQDPMTSLNPVKRIGAQLTESLRYHRRARRSAAEASALDLLEQVQIPDPKRRLRQYPHELSGGMRQRIVIAMALACEPKLLIADEPTTALDVTVQKRILDLLDELRRERDMGLILITHDLGVVRDRADEICVMYAGRVAERAPTHTLFAEMRHPYTRALLDTIPRLDAPSHSRLQPIPGRPPVLLDLPPGCRFAPRCRHAQARCLDEDPPLGDELLAHRFACFFPVGTPEGEAALAANLAAGRTAAGRPIDDEQEEVA